MLLVRFCVGAGALLAAACAQDSSLESAGADSAAAAQSGTAGLSSPVQQILRIADATMAGGDATSAANLYARASQLSPEHPLPHLRLGVALHVLGAHGDAEKAFRRSLAIDDANGDARRGLGNVLVALDRPGEAIAEFESAIATEPKPSAYNGLGVALDMLGRQPAAQAVYREGLKASPGNLALRNNLGLSLALGGDYDLAIAEIRRVLAEPGANALHRRNLAIALGLAGRADAGAMLGRATGTPETGASSGYFDWLRNLPPGLAARVLARDADGRLPAAAAGGPPGAKPGTARRNTAEQNR